MSGVHYRTAWMNAVQSEPGWGVTLNDRALGHSKA